MPTRLTRTTGNWLLVMLSVLERPVSTASIRSGAPGATGARVSMRMLELSPKLRSSGSVDRSTTLPAASCSVGDVPDSVNALTVRSATLASVAATV